MKAQVKAVASQLKAVTEEETDSSTRRLVLKTVSIRFSQRQPTVCERITREGSTQGGEGTGPEGVWCFPEKHCDASRRIRREAFAEEALLGKPPAMQIDACVEHGESFPSSHES